jgi:Protein of unknown function (DUF3618)
MAQPDTVTPTPRPSRSPEEVSAALETARQSLVAHVDAIQEKVSPANLAKRPITRIRRIFVTDEGEPKVRTIAITAGVVAIYVLYRIRR